MNKSSYIMFSLFLAVCLAITMLGDATLGEEKDSSAEHLKKAEAAEQVKRPKLKRRRDGQRQPRPKTVVPEGVRAYHDQAYAEMDGHKMLLDVFTPEKEGGPWPIVVWIHGGGWRRGDKEGCPHMELAKRGLCAAVSINYRLTDVAPLPAQIEDCKAAIRFLRANAAKYNLDPDRIGVYGGSAGGHLAALVGTSSNVKELETQGGNFEHSSCVQAVCDWYGPSDLTKMEGDVIEDLLGGPLEEKMDLARQCSPLTHVSPDDPPFLIMHGDDDSTVPHDHSVWLAEALEEAGVAVEFITVDTLKGVGHGFSTAATPVSELREKSLSFFIEQFVTKE